MFRSKSFSPSTPHFPPLWIFRENLKKRFLIVLTFFLDHSIPHLHPRVLKDRERFKAVPAVQIVPYCDILLRNIITLFDPSLIVHSFTRGAAHDNATLEMYEITCTLYSRHATPVDSELIREGWGERKFSKSRHWLDLLPGNAWILRRSVTPIFL